LRWHRPKGWVWSHWIFAVVHRIGKEYDPGTRRVPPRNDTPVEAAFDEGAQGKGHAYYWLRNPIW